ncbi:2-iminoacetate synthase ThiH [bacterium]|nr:2-iminoacetate synthase ThiH [bacterium]
MHYSKDAEEGQVRQALDAAAPGEKELSTLLSPAARPFIEAMAQRARTLTRRHIGRTIGLYAPLYLSSHCPGGCTYCGFASDRENERHSLSAKEAAHEMAAMSAMKLDEVLLLTGERTPKFDFHHLKPFIEMAARQFDLVGIEVFPMDEAEYRELAGAGCTSVTLYQETYDAAQYDRYHRWGPKKNYLNRIDAPARALSGGLRYVGMGALLGLSDPIYDMLALYRHARYLQKKYWKAGISISFPRIQPQRGDFQPDYMVDDTYLAQIIFAFRIVMPEVQLVLSTRESQAFRDGMAGVGVSKMSVASKTTVGGYSDDAGYEESQFQISDDRDVETFCEMLKSKDLEPVFKNWDTVYRDGAEY